MINNKAADNNTGNGDDTFNVELSNEIPEGWQITPSSSAVTISKGDSRNQQFTVFAPSDFTSGAIEAWITVASEDGVTNTTVEVDIKSARIDLRIDKSSINEKSYIYEVGGGELIIPVENTGYRSAGTVNVTAKMTDNSGNVLETYPTQTISVGAGQTVDAVFEINKTSIKEPRFLVSVEIGDDSTFVADGGDIEPFDFIVPVTLETIEEDSAWLMVVILASVLLVQGVRRIPIQYAKRGASGQIAAARQYLPLKVNAAGVMPIIFAQAIMFIPITFAGLSDSEGVQSFVAAFSDFSGFWYNFVFGLLIILFTYFYTAITVNTNQMADDMKKNGGFIPGVKPGRKTAEFLDDAMSKITLPGSLFLAFVAILPAFAMQFGVNQGFAQFYGGTSLLIMVGVVLDTLQQIESHLLMRHYDGLTSGGGRIKGKSSTGMMGS